MTTTSFAIVWADEAQQTFNYLPGDVQTNLLSQLPHLVTNYARLYLRRPANSVAVSTISHLQVPAWGMWLRLKTEYHESELGPVLLAYEFDELSRKEFEESLSTTREQRRRNK
ncbi:MAG: hypothetical protein EOO39_21025 [Cytophagaceae bacterium]|nr:MAG: hypothetical protein EOO39_21025 [Cytophagaceae bacterium]